MKAEILRTIIGELAKTVSDAFHAAELRIVDADNEADARVNALVKINALHYKTLHKLLDMEEYFQNAGRKPVVEEPEYIEVTD